MQHGCGAHALDTDLLRLPLLSPARPPCRIRGLALGPVQPQVASPYNLLCSTGGIHTTLPSSCLPSRPSMVRPAESGRPSRTCAAAQPWSSNLTAADLDYRARFWIWIRRWNPSRPRTTQDAVALSQEGWSPASHVARATTTTRPPPSWLVRRRLWSGWNDASHRDARGGVGDRDPISLSFLPSSLLEPPPPPPPPPPSPDLPSSPGIKLAISPR